MIRNTTSSFAAARKEAGWARCGRARCPCARRSRGRRTGCTGKGPPPRTPAKRGKIHYFETAILLFTGCSYCQIHWLNAQLGFGIFHHLGRRYLPYGLPASGTCQIYELVHPSHVNHSMNNPSVYEDLFASFIDSCHGHRPQETIFSKRKWFILLFCWSWTSWL